MTVRVEGAEQLRRLALELRAVGEVELRRELYKGLSRALKPAKPAVAESILANLPRAGGLNHFIAESTVLKRKIRTLGRSVGALVIAEGKHDIRNLNKGRLRHPLYGDRGHWYDQEITPGFFDRPLLELEPLIQGEFIAVMVRIERLLADG